MRPAVRQAAHREGSPAKTVAPLTPLADRSTAVARAGLPAGIGNRQVALLARLLSGTPAGPPARPARARLMRFDAARHEEQGMRAAGLDPYTRLGHPKNLSRPTPKPGSKEHGVSAIYAGNFMQDFSQFHSPMFHKILAGTPRDPVKVMQGGKSDAVGAAGGKILADALIRALAIIELGPTLANGVIVQNMQNWKPEQHVEQPAGYELADALDPASELEGSAIPGTQMENRELLKISDTGLQKHIYNSTEWAKNHLVKASLNGATDQGRFHVGAALHAIQDYFAHSNFIEVGLNSYIDWAQAAQQKDRTRKAKLGGVGKFLTQVKLDARDRKKAHSRQARSGGGGAKTHVDTLFDSRAKSGRQAITTGSFGGSDLRSSIGHLLLPSLPKVADAIDKGIMRVFDLMMAEDSTTWADLERKAGDERPTLAVKALADGLDKAGMRLPAPMLVAEVATLDLGPMPSIPFPTPKVKMVELPVTQAVDQFKTFVRDVRATIKSLQILIAFVGDTPLTQQLKDAALKRLEEERKRLEKQLKDEVGKTRDTVRSTINNFLIDMVDKLAGVDTRKGSKRTIQDALTSLDEAIEDVDSQSSLEVRMLDKGDLAGKKKADVERIVGPVDEVLDKKGKHRGWRSKLPLAPSHSELSKDHGPSERMHAGSKDVSSKIDQLKPKREPLDPSVKQPKHEREHGEGSLFFGLADALATEATRHTTHQVERMWRNQDTGYSVFGDGKVMGPQPGKLNFWDETVPHDVFAREARSYVQSRKPTAKGQKFAQMGASRELVEKRPELRTLLDMVDLIISHPDDTKWWRPIFDSYVNAHPAEVAEHIVHRNATRGSRQRIT